MCGEYVFTAVWTFNFFGSPPRVWGIPHRRSNRCVHRRFTPTCVGNTLKARTLPSIFSVHPHVCGEYGIGLPAFFSFFGSPPRVWGILRNRCLASLRKRFTPTCVGNTLRRSSADAPAPVHPHVCGEYVNSADASRRVTGSPPRVWGIRMDSHSTLRCPRFTPTCVGNTWQRSASSYRASVHPHVCGEY